LGVFDQALVSGTSFLTMLAVGRLGGAQELGTFALAMSVVMVAAAFQDALVAIPFTIRRPRLPAERRAAHAGNTLVQVCLFGVLAGLVLATAVYLVSGQSAPRMLPLVVGIAATSVLLRQFARRYTFAEGTIGQSVVLDAGVSAVQLSALAVIFLGGWMSTTNALFALALASLLVPAVWLYRRSKSFRPRRALLTDDWQDHWRCGRWLLGGEMLSVSCGYATAWILALTMDRTAVGVFAACNVIMQISNPFSLGFGNVLEGRAARAFARGGPMALRTELVGAARWFIAVVGAVTVLAMWYGARFVELLYGPAYADQGQTIALLALASFAMACGIAASCGLRVMGRADLTFAACGLDLGILVSVALIFAPRFGLPAVAAGVLAGSLCGTLFRVWSLVRVGFEQHPRAEALDAVQWQNQ
jgi:O-antigen/teichoic acid export membrane protein